MKAVPDDVAAFTAADFRRRVVEGPAAAPGEEFGDYVLNPHLRELIVGRPLRNAAVLVPVVDRPQGASVILTKRSDALRAHSGQVAFPGGRIDPDDVSAEAAALREAQEEIGLAAEHVEIVGRMPDYVTGSGYRVAPVLSIVEPRFTLTINPDEVDEAFEVPLAFLMQPTNHLRESRVWQEQERFFYNMPHERHRIWGVTAGIIRTLYERLYA